MDKRFLYVMLVIAVIVGIILFAQDKNKGDQNEISKKFPTETSYLAITPSGNPTPTTAISVVYKYMIASESAGSSTSASQTKVYDSGLKVEDLNIGQGREVKEGDTISINYVGVLENGQKFDSSYERKQPFVTQIGVGQVIKGWDIGVIGMKVGGKRRLVIPPQLGYGEQGTDNGAIPPNATLIFDVELLLIK